MSDTKQIAVFTVPNGDVSLITFDRGGFPVWEVGRFFDDGRETVIEQFVDAQDAYKRVVELVGYNATAETADGGLQLVTVTRSRKVWRAAGHSAPQSGSPEFNAVFVSANKGRTQFRVDQGAMYLGRLNRMFKG